MTRRRGNLKAFRGTPYDGTPMKLHNPMRTEGHWTDLRHWLTEAIRQYRIRWSEPRLRARPIRGRHRR